MCLKHSELGVETEMRFISEGVRERSTLQNERIANDGSFVVALS